ncbi:hypothetical protein K440DRAFT_634743 [Wilcoxina mikolae CBS 423.85]|nr:hypothetical protein K440DRAFT_634743 [Wilcoxina mikolae CBS 423.85]
MAPLFVADSCCEMGEIYQSSWPYQCTDDSVFHCRWYPHSTKHGWTFLDLLKEDARLTESAGCELQRLATKLLLSASYGCHAFCCMRERITNTSNLKLYGRTYNPAILPIGEHLRKFWGHHLDFPRLSEGQLALCPPWPCMPKLERDMTVVPAQYSKPRSP